MLKVYPAILHKEDGYWIEFPDLEGCQTFGNTLEETMELAQEALGLFFMYPIRLYRWIDIKLST